MRQNRIILGCAVAVLLLCGRASAQVITEFTAGISANALPWAITAGPVADGNVWFTEQSGNRIGRITPAGVITEFGTGITGSAILGITAGPDGNLWFTELSGKIGRMTPAGVVTEFTVGGCPWGIATGSDGNVWFTEYCNPGAIGRIIALPANGVVGTITEFFAGISPNGGIEAITAGPDGNLWFANQNNDVIGRITTAGVVTEFPIGSFAQSRGITSGPDGNVWFTEYAGSRIGKIIALPANGVVGTVTEFSTGITAGAQPRGITTGPDGNLWFTEQTGNRIGRITPAGVITEFSTNISASSQPLGIAAGADGNLWFAEEAGNRIGRITTVSPPPVFAGAVSRRMHGAATFDLPLTLLPVTNPTTEPRQGPAQTIVFTFDKPISAAAVTITEGTATAAAPIFSGNGVVVGLTNVINQQYVTVALTNVSSADGGTGASGSVRVGFLLGDVSQNRVVTVADLGLVNAQLAQPVTAANYLKDVNVTGTLTVADKGITNANLTKALPAP